ncbi:hypothetical protein BD769DRAFT_1666804 [Suillus cothurnatus]|nr:hypothetical protein BD769DRAFT_1666804 [Suillus cothurnatus]
MSLSSSPLSPVPSPSVPSSPTSSASHSIWTGPIDLPSNFVNIEADGRRREKQSYVMSLDGIDVEDDDQDRLFTKFSIDTVYSSYLASRYRVRQYTQLLMLLKREEDAWAQRVKHASRLMPDYIPPMAWNV